MDGWIKWLGELVWRLSGLPAKVKGDEREENFYYRLYGVLCLFLSLVALAYFVYKTADPLSKMAAELAKYAGPDKILTQGFAGALAIIAVFAIVIAMAFLMAMAISVLAGLGLLAMRFIGRVSYWWAKKFKAKQEAKELTPEQREAWSWAIVVIGLLAAFIIWMALKTGANPPEKLTPDKPPKPPDEKKEDPQPAA